MLFRGPVFYSQHARNEMRSEQFGAIREHEVYEAASTRAVIEEYPEDQPYPSVLVLGRTSAGRCTWCARTRRQRITW
jgi:hypothetical protein